MKQNFSRREFVATSAQSACAIALGSLVIDLAALARGRAAVRPDETILLTFKDYPDLTKTGGATVIEAKDGDILILVARVTRKKFYAVSLKCTHLGCEVKYESEANGFVCPCHGSEYELNGVLRSGPAKKPLSSFPIVFNEEKEDLTLSLTPVEGGVNIEKPEAQIDSLKKIDSVQVNVKDSVTKENPK